MCKTLLELQEGNENMNDMESFKVFTFFWWEGLSAFNIACKELMIMIFIFYIFYEE